ncbi:sterol desaturase/sphingolipid hydroxylase (fatty acid hydroxylase superfamily) [Trueperella bonasi]|uniref:Sterol desaturase/sphingolipid hydroxylase (Fatty acid hydroxylase superfamily) n=1 Tax=Trueperella bonasi TaxID=312286 RepID=A0ABT9NFK1_9ACTO|nr:hypothetical protein [Trueperella bonasi]MDP9806161.1 sterol desaturase/sphingolipid hydroxylase (fatty acid hydroxylase superfamily) [Trueperella bonasi]
MRLKLKQAWWALRLWTSRQWTVTGIAGLIVGLIIGLATVLIPNPIFGRDIPPVWWNYPVWIATSALMGMLVATYVKSPQMDEKSETRTTALGTAGGILAWFAVGCPVCNKIALIALGYSGAITWFAPVQPWLGVIALIFTALALVYRLSGQISCTISTKPKAEAVAKDLTTASARNFIG